MQVVAHLLEHLEVALRPHLIEDDAHDVEILSEVEESIDLGSQRIGSRSGIDHEYHRESQRQGNLCRRALVTMIPVEESHHALYDADVGIVTVVTEEFLHMRRCCHEGVEINRGTVTDGCMELSVDIVGTTFEGLYAEPLLREERHQASGNRCFARATGGSRYHKSWFHTAKVEKIFGIYA